MRYLTKDQIPALLFCLSFQPNQKPLSPPRRMSNKTACLFLFLFTAASIRLAAQNMYLIDSLRKRATVISLTPIQHIQTLLTLSEEVQELDSTESRKCAQEAFGLAHKAGIDTLAADALFRMARMNISLLHFSSAKQQLEQLKQISSTKRYTNGTGKYYQAMGFFLLGQHEENDADHKKIVDCFNQAEACFRKTGNHLELGKSFLGLTKFYFDDKEGNKMDSTAQLGAKELNLAGDALAKARYFQFIGKAYHYMNRASKSYDFYLQAYTFSSKIRDSLNMAFLKISIGKAQLAQGEDTLAYMTTQEGIKILSTIEHYHMKNCYLYYSFAYSHLAEIYSKRKKKQECLDNYRKALFYNKLSGKAFNEPLILGNMGISFSEFGELDSALEVQKKALNLRIKFHNKEGEMFSYITLAELSLLRKEYKKSLEWSKKATPISSAGFHSYDNSLYMVLYQAYDSIKDFKDAFIYSEKYHAFVDSIAKLNKASDIKQMVQKQEEEKRETLRVSEEKVRTGLHEAELKRQHLFRNLAILILILVSVASIFVFRSYLGKRKANETLSKQRDEIQIQKHIVDEKNREIVDSIQYAKRIQSVLLPSEKDMDAALPNNFVLFQPKDIVSGDFYWLSHREDCVLLAIADCTGHGVPGAFMSMLGTALLNEIVNEKKVHEPADILDLLRIKIIEALKQKGESGENQDGMDICMLKMDKRFTKVTYAGANNSIYIFRDKVLTEYKADKQPIGITGGPVRQFTQHDISVLPGDIIYAFTDGFADQFGGPKGKKFKYKQLEEQLLAISSNEMSAQRQQLFSSFQNWKGNLEQVDDVTVIGIRV
jgi:serine phosphatase RsbU (regulator of sigma subunit)